MKCLNKVVSEKSKLALGLGWLRFLGIGKKSRMSPLTAERERFEREVREQFLKLKEKGISIPIFTL